MERKIERVLIVRNDRIGDVILTLPIAQTLRLQYPSVHIALLVQRYTSEIVEDSRCVDEIIFYDDGSRPVPFFQLIATLRTGRFDVVFHTRPRFRLSLMTFLARIPIRVGTGYRWYSMLFNRKVYEHRKDAAYHESEYNLHLLKAIGFSVPRDRIFPVLNVREENTRRIRLQLEESGIGPQDLLVILHPGSGGSARDWSREKFGALGRKLAEIPRVRVLVVGREDERELVLYVCGMIGPCAISWINRLSLREYAALAREARLFIANSTGPLHIAAAVGTRVIGLYSQIVALSAARWGPYTSDAVVFSPVGKPADCKMCLSGKSKLCECMDSIRVEDVFDAATRFLRERAAVKAS